MRQIELFYKKLKPDLMLEKEQSRNWSRITKPDRPNLEELEFTAEWIFFKPKKKMLRYMKLKKWK